MLDFLNDITLNEEVVEMKENKGPTKGRVATPRNPTNGADIRLFKDGSIYPSQALKDEFDLEYRNKDEEGGKAFDCFEAHNWRAYPKTLPNIVLIAAVSKDAPKTDIFGSTKFNEDGSPTSTVLEQGAATFGKKLIEMVAAVTGSTHEMMFTGKNYIDLMIVRDRAIATESGIYLFPKTVSRGKDVGAMTYERRENAAPMPLMVWNEPKEVEPTEQTSEEIAAQ